MNRDVLCSHYREKGANTLNFFLQREHHTTSNCNFRIWFRDRLPQISVQLSIGVCQAQLKTKYKKLEELVEMGKVLRLF